MKWFKSLTLLVALFGAQPALADDPVIEVIILDTTGDGTWTVPSDWNNAAYTIALYGGGASFFNDAGLGKAGGGGAYASTSSLVFTPGDTINYHVGAGGAAYPGSPLGENTWFVDSSTLMAHGGGYPSDNNVGGQASDSIGDVTASGGDGALGTGGGGAAGSQYGDGGFGSPGIDDGVTGVKYGGGGGGGVSGNNGVNNASNLQGATGGNGPTGTGGATGATNIADAAAAADGGGGGGGYGNDHVCSSGSTDDEYYALGADPGYGPGGGGGGSGGVGVAGHDSSVTQAPCPGGLYGGGEGGAGSSPGSTYGGSQGLIVIFYIPAAPPASAGGSMLLLGVGN